MIMLKEYLYEVRHCSCETFQQRYDHLKPAIYLSTIFFLGYYLIIKGPHYNFSGEIFTKQIIAGSFPLLGFVLSYFLARKVIINQILTLPTMGCYAAAFYSLLNQDFYQAEPYLYSHMILVGMFYGSFISSIRCNLILILFGSALPFMAAAFLPHLNGQIILQQMPVVFFAGMLGSVFSFRLNSYQKSLKVLQTNLNSEKESLEKAQTISKLGNWEFDIASGAIIWSKQMFSIFPEEVEKGEPAFERHRSTIHQEDIPLWEETVQKCIQSGEPYKMQFRTFQKDMETIV